MSRSFTAALSVLAFLAFAAPASAANTIASAFTRVSSGESLEAVFTNPIGGSTTGTYSGMVEVLVSGIGDIGPGTADAFYVFGYDQGGDYYELSLGTGSSPLMGSTPSQTILRAISFIDGVGAVPIGTRPAFRADAKYHFVVDLGLIGVSTPTTLQFGITEGVYSDNGGHYDVTVYQLGNAEAAVPQPASWAMMVGGFGLLGGALRRRRIARAA